MKQITLILFLGFYHFSFSQNTLTVITATKNQAKIFVGDNPAKDWGISPDVKPDVFTTGKLAGPATIRFKTDSDSIVFNLKPGQRKDFIVLLNGKDSCYTSIQSQATKDFSKVKPEFHDSIPFRVNKQNTNYVTAVVNKTDTLQLNFDSGTTELVLTNEALKTIKSGIKLYDTPYEIQIGRRTYKAKVYDAELTGDGTVGRFGWNIFDEMIVELNYDKNLMVVHSKMPAHIKKDKAYTKLGIKYYGELFFVEGSISQSGVSNKDWFLFDTGYQRATMLDNDLVKQNNFPTDKMPVIKKVIMHGAQGNEIPVITADLEKLRLGKYELKNIPAQIVTTNKPLRGATVHILGNEILKRFNTVLDFQENVVYLKPSKHFNEQYTEKK